MLLSKQEFSKLSKTDKDRLLGVKSNNKKGKKPRTEKSRKNSNLGSNSRGAPMSKAPVANSRTVKTARPVMTSLRNGDCVVTHREYVGEVQASNTGPPTTYNAQSFPINPGMPNLFPWLSRIAANFESFNFTKLKFCYETEAPSSLGGTLVLAVDYDALDAVPSSKQQALAYRGSVRSAPWNDCCHTSLAEDLHKFKSRFVRKEAIPASADLKTYDVGNLFVITQGVTTSNAVCGELYVEYSVHLMTPAYEPTPIIGGSALSSLSGSVMSNIFGPNPRLDPQSVGFSLDNNSRLTFSQPGDYVLVTQLEGNTITDLKVDPSSLTGVEILQLNFQTNDDDSIANTTNLLRVNLPGSSCRVIGVGTAYGSAALVALARGPLGGFTPT